MEPIKNGAYIEMVSPADDTYEMRTKGTAFGTGASTYGDGLDPNIVCVQIFKNGRKIVEVGMDGKVALFNTTIDDASRAFWYAFGEYSPFMFELTRLREHFFRIKDKIDNVTAIERERDIARQDLSKTLSRLKSEETKNKFLQDKLKETQADDIAKLKRDIEEERKLRDQLVADRDKQVNELLISVHSLQQSNIDKDNVINKLNTSLQVAKGIISKLAPFARDIVYSRIDNLIDQWERSI